MVALPIVVVDRNTKHGYASRDIVYRGWIDSLRPNAPRFGEIIRADGTANYYDKYYPRTIRK